MVGSIVIKGIANFPPERIPWIAPHGGMVIVLWFPVGTFGHRGNPVDPSATVAPGDPGPPPVLVGAGVIHLSMHGRRAQGQVVEIRHTSLGPPVDVVDVAIGWCGVGPGG